MGVDMIEIMIMINFFFKKENLIILHSDYLLSTPWNIDFIFHKIFLHLKTNILFFWISHQYAHV